MKRLRKRAFIAGAVGAAVCLVGGIINPRQFFYSYLLAYVLWLGVTLGSLGLLMVQHLSGGAWGFVLRRQLEGAARLVPVMGLLFIPILIGLRTLYPWARSEVVAADPILQGKQIYLNIPFFVLRAGFYFTIWAAIGWVLSYWSLMQDERGEQPLGRRMQAVSAAGLILYVLTMTFASVDWLMSLEPHWYSTIFSIVVISGQGLSAIAVAIIALAALSNDKRMAQVVVPARFHDLGNLMLMFLMVWAYVSFSQFLIIWSANLPEEIPWYTHRIGDEWQWIGLGLVVFHFAIPFALLLSRRTKRIRRRLVPVAVSILVMRTVDLFWVVGPERSPAQFHVHWLDIVLPITLGCVWVALYTRQLQGRSLLPKYVDEGSAPEGMQLDIRESGFRRGEPSSAGAHERPAIP
jgi:hypothetical protein